jgi:hypothetical protein
MGIVFINLSGEALLPSTQFGTADVALASARW